MNDKKTLDAALWVKNYADYLYCFAIRRVGDDDVANDLVQDTFLSALQKAPGFEGNCTELTWLRTILKNKIIDYYRKQASGLNAITDRQTNCREDCDHFFEENGMWAQRHAPQPFGIEGHSKLDIKEFYYILDSCLQKLPVLWMSVFKMKHIDDETTEEICQALKVSSSNYWVIIHRARLNLRECMQKNWT